MKYERIENAVEILRWWFFEEAVISELAEVRGGRTHAVEWTIQKTGSEERAKVLVDGDRIQWETASGKTGTSLLDLAWEWGIPEPPPHMVQVVPVLTPLERVIDGVVGSTDLVACSRHGNARRDLVRRIAELVVQHYGASE